MSPICRAEVHCVHKRLLFLLTLLALLGGTCLAQEGTSAGGSPEDLAPPENVQIDPQADDEDIAARLERILAATSWFDDTQVQVDEGVVFLEGTADSSEHKEWAASLARKTESVVAVVNQFSVQQRPIWDLSPAWKEMREMLRLAVQGVPSLAIALAIICLAWLASSATFRIAKSLTHNRMNNRLLANVVSRAIAIPVLLLGIYFALRVSGMTQIAATVLGGTGLAGLILGIAFRDIAENFLASILISLQRPFSMGDLIEVENHQGFVRSVTTRGTLLMTLDGNHVQIPNSSIYKNVIYNFTANPNVRCDFIVGIDYADSVTEAQEVILSVLTGHEAVLPDPEPMILVDELGASTVNLKIYFWLDGHAHSMLKVRSAVIRLVKLAIEAAGLTMPDESREMIFPQGVPVYMQEPNGEPAPNRTSPPPPQESISPNRIEQNLTSEKEELEQQDRKSNLPNQGENLLQPAKQNQA